jgi:hypothetical protein
MIKKFLVIFLAFFGNFLYSEDTKNLPFYKETEHFQAYCLERDIDATEEVLLDLESFSKKYTQDFNFSFPDEKIKLCIYPDIQTYHQTSWYYDKESRADYKIANYNPKDNTFSLVTHHNCGPLHTKESAIKCGRWILGLYVMVKKYGFDPDWLSYGLALFEVDMYTKDQIYQYLLNKDNQIKIPSISQLEGEDVTQQGRAWGVSRYVLAKFLVDNWGMDKARAVMDDYASFESILGISKEEFCQKCIEYYQPKI